MTSEYEGIRKCEEDAKVARKAIISTIAFKYLVEFSHPTKDCCNNDAFEKLIEYRLEEFEKERQKQDVEQEIQRRVQEQVKKNRKNPDNMSDDEDL